MSFERPDRIHHGQPYWRAGHRNHTTRDGRETILDVWRSFCAECGEPFHSAQPSGSERFEPARRCETHRKPGCRVK
jgi:hypothetical protein